MRHVIKEKDIENYITRSRVDCASASGPPHSKRLAWVPFQCMWIVTIDGREEPFKSLRDAVEFYNDH